MPIGIAISATKQRVTFLFYLGARSLASYAERHLRAIVSFADSEALASVGRTTDKEELHAA